MALIFLSKECVAEENREKIQSVKETFSQVIQMDGCITKLTVIERMIETAWGITASNDAYKELLSKDATAIADIKTEYDEFDKKLSDCMGIE